jgi:hypothetical protein
VDDSCIAFVPQGGLRSPTDDERIQHISVHMEVPGVAGHAVATLTVLSGLGTLAGTGSMRTVGVVLAHDADASSMTGELLSLLTTVRHPLNGCL